MISEPASLQSFSSSSIFEPLSMRSCSSGKNWMIADSMQRCTSSGKERWKEQERRVFFSWLPSCFASCPGNLDAWKQDCLHTGMRQRPPCENVWCHVSRGVWHQRSVSGPYAKIPWNKWLYLKKKTNQGLVWFCDSFCVRVLQLRVVSCCLVKTRENVASLSFVPRLAKL